MYLGFAIKTNFSVTKDGLITIILLLVQNTVNKFKVPI